MPTFQQLIDTTRARYLASWTAQEANRLAAPCGSGDTSLSFLNQVGTMQIAGAIIAIDLEVMSVWATSGTQATLVDRGQYSSIAAAHSSGTRVEVAPRFPQFDVANAINEELGALRGAGLFKVGDVEITYNPAIQGYDLGNISWDDILSIRIETAGPAHNWPTIRKYSQLRNADTTQFPSGNGLVIYEPGWPGLPIRVQYKGPLGQLANLTDDLVTVSGLQATAADIPPLGAGIRLMAGGEYQRNNLRQQRDPALVTSVPAGAAAASPKNLMMIRAQRIADEAANLARLYPKVSPN